jgi:hypothetical protein
VDAAPGVLRARSRAADEARQWLAFRRLVHP